MQVLEYIQKHKPSLIAIDANVSSDVLKSIVIYANANGVKSGLKLFIPSFVYSRCLSFLVSRQNSSRDLHDSLTCLQ